MSSPILIADQITTWEARTAGKTILVMGDVMLDRYLWCRVRRISPEAPVPVARLERQTEVPGGAGNVAINLAGLGARVAIHGWIGDDPEGRRLVQLLTDAGVDGEGLVRVLERPTTTKSRIVGEHQQMLRLDVEETTPMPRPAVEMTVGAMLKRMAGRPAAVLLSDYAKGGLGPTICKTILDEARRLDIPALVDPKGSDFAKYAGATAITPNRAELALATGVSVEDLDGLHRAGRKLVVDLGLDFLVLTLGELGMSLIDVSGVHRIPTMARQVFDVSGAGDTVVATLATAIAAGLDPSAAVALANLAAGLVVGKLGTAPVTSSELLREIEKCDHPRPSAKLLGAEELTTRLAEWRKRGERIVFTNGCFDVLHAGHAACLEQARALGDRLIVGLNSDSSVRRLKGSSRPLNRAEDRAQMLAALASVDAVISFEEDTPLGLILALRPDVLIKGGDYAEGDIAGAAEVRSWGGDVVIIPLLRGLSTSGLIGKLYRD